MNQNRALAILFVVSMSCARLVAASVDPFHLQRLDNERYSHALASLACAPTDGPAFNLYLLNTRSKKLLPEKGYIRITIYQDPALLAHQRLDWQAFPTFGQVVRCSDGSCLAANAGHIAFGNIKVGKSADGEIDLHFTNGVQVRQRFRARWPRTPVAVCG